MIGITEHAYFAYPRSMTATPKRSSALQTQRVMFPTYLLWSDGGLRIAVRKPLCCHGRTARQHLKSCEGIAKTYWANIMTSISYHFTSPNILSVYGEDSFKCI